MKFNQSSQHRPPRDLNQSLSTLQRISRSITGELQNLDIESALIDALQRKPMTSIGHYQVYTDFSRENQTTVFVHDPSGEEQHKYVLAHTDTQTFIVAAPMRWTFLHKSIVARVMASTEDAVFCSGGGFVSIETVGKLRVDGASTDYGAGDHAKAQAALAAAVKNSSVG
jgi:hypothetical protein